LQIKVLPAEHNCATTKLREGKMASQGWCADRLSDWVKKNPNKGPKDAKEKLEGDYGIKLKYSKLGQARVYPLPPPSRAPLGQRRPSPDSRRHRPGLRIRGCTS